MGELVLYFDRCFGSRFPKAVESLRPPFAVKSHYGMKFKDNTPDDEWLRRIGGEGWIVLSHDARFHLDSAALEAIHQFKIGCFYLWGAQLPVWNKIGFLTGVFPKIKKIAGSEKAPYIYRAAQNGRLHLVRHWDGRAEPKKYAQSARSLQTGRS